MFGRKKMYKKGVEDAMHAYEQFGKKQEEALEKIREEIQVGNKKFEDMITSLGDDLIGVYDFLSGKEKAALYQLCTPKDIKDLGEEEKRVLVAVLYQLADEEGAWGLTDNQKKYIRSVQKYLEITNPQTSIDLNVVGDIDSVDDQKAIMQTVLEFYYLQDATEISDLQEEFLDNFCLNKKQAQQIEMYVAKLYNTVGPDGLCEKYGFIPNDESDLEDNPREEIGCDDYSCYYDLRIGAIRRWVDDVVVVEPRYKPKFYIGVHNIGNKILWGCVENEEYLYYVSDVITTKRLKTITYNNEERLEGIAENFYCVAKGEKCVIKDFDDGVICNIPYVVGEHHELCFLSPFFGKYIVGLYNNSDRVNIHIEDCSERVIAYNITDGTNFEVDVLRLGEGFFTDLYVFDGYLYMVLTTDSEHEYYDIWCYDLEKKSYKWKQYKVFYSYLGFMGSYGLNSRFNMMECAGKLFYYYGISSGEDAAYIVLDKETGRVLKEKKFNFTSKGSNEIMQFIGNSIFFMHYGYRNGKDFYMGYEALDVNDLTENTDEIKEIVKKMHIE